MSDPAAGTNNATWARATTNGHWVETGMDCLGRTLSVAQPGNSGATTQTRTFNYDLATGRLTSAANPENGTVSYTYNADATPATKTDARNQQVQYSYDSYRRVTQIRRYPVSGGAEDLCQRTDFTYDGGVNGWGRLTSTSWGGESCTGGAWSQSYDYTQAGLVTSKTQSGGGFNLEAQYTYNNEGKLVSTLYPYGFPRLTYTYDSMGRPITLTDSDATPPFDYAKDVLYNAAGQITQMKYLRSGSNYYTETRGYNVLQQMTQLTVSRTSTVLDYRYTFSDTQNDGRITQRQELVSGETVQYQYDSLKRLTSAATTGPEWGQSFGYDGFGNLLQQTVTKGSAPSLSVTVNPATNRITTGGYGYDSNGNLTAMPNLTMSYDVENRLVQATQTYNGTELYGYDPSGRRVWKQEPSRTLVYFYGVEGTLLRTLGDGDDTDDNVYFGGKLIWAEASQGLAAGPVSQDRLGSAALRNGTSAKYFPYGEEGTTTTQDRTKFATYYRDQITALDYAHNRYYGRTIGRFTSPDPYVASGGPADPQSWNRYAYVQNDPVNFNDPTGLLKEAPSCPPGTTISLGGTCVPYTLPFQSPASLTVLLQPLVLRGSIAEYDDFHGIPTAAEKLPRFDRTTDELARKQLKAAIEALRGTRCGQILPLDSVLTVGSRDVHFYDVRDGSAYASVSQNYVSRNGSSVLLGQTGNLGGSAAVFWGKNSEGYDIILPFVVLQPNWWSTGESGYTLIHEVLHYAMNLGHEGFQFEIWLASLGYRVKDELGGSNDITVWLQEGCPDRSKP